jgi:DNA invertase Pin-like site-specific DNA recombinase
VKPTAIYARVSTRGQQDNYSFGMQENDCERYVAKQKDMEITHRLVEVKSGRTLDRDELQKLLTLIRNREVDAVVVGKLDRLSRNVAQLSTIAGTCHEFGVELHYADFGRDEDTPMGRMIRNMRGAYAEFEADIIYERTQGARDAAMEERIFGAAPKAPYGHRFIGEKRNKQMVVDEDEATVVRLMRDMVLRDNLGTPAIASRLTTMQIPTPGRTYNSQGNWNASSVYRILTDHSIAGTYYHGRWKRAKRGDKYAKPTDPSEWRAFPCEPIISPEEFTALQKKLAEHRELSKRNARRFYLLGSRIKCKCGRSMSGDTHGYNKNRVYRCLGSKSVTPTKIRCTPTNLVYADAMEHFVWNWLITQIEPANLKAGLIAEREKAAEIIGELVRQIAIQERALGELDKRLARIQDGYNGGFYTIDEAKFQKQQIAPAIRAVREEKERLEELLAEATRSEEDDSALMREAETLYEEAKSVTEGERKRWFLDRLNVRVVVERIAQEYTVDLSCILGGNSFSHISI